jgi:hypothetical protein
MVAQAAGPDWWGLILRIGDMKLDELTPGMKNPTRNRYLTMEVGMLRKEIDALTKTCVAILGFPSPRLDAVLLDAQHKLRFAQAAMLIRGEAP